jgi:hypothetical protein
MGNSVSIPPYNFKEPSRWHCRVKKVKNYEFASVTNGISSIPRFYENLCRYYLVIICVLADITAEVLVWFV